LGQVDRIIKFFEPAFNEKLSSGAVVETIAATNGAKDLTGNRRSANQ